MRRQILSGSWATEVSWVASREELWARLAKLSERQRTAFAVGCAERVLCLYEVDCGPQDHRIDAVVNLCWKYAGGEEPESEEIGAADAGLREAIPKLDEGGSGLAYLACIALGFALDAIDDPTAESAVNGAVEALDAVDVFEDYFEPESRTWSVAEHAWQLRALSVCESKVGVISRVDFFSLLGPLPPEWFRSRSDAAE